MEIIYEGGEVKLKRFVTWDEVERFVENVSNTYNGVITGVYGLPRGGLVLATMISHRLNVPLLLGAFPGCLVVDDICDTGESLIHYVNNTANDNKGFNTATMFYKENELNVEPDFYMFEKHNDWIVFPWENKEED